MNEPINMIINLPAQVAPTLQAAYNQASATELLLNAENGGLTIKAASTVGSILEAVGSNNISVLSAGADGAVRMSKLHIEHAGEPYSGETYANQINMYGFVDGDTVPVFSVNPIGKVVATDITLNRIGYTYPSLYMFDGMHNDPIISLDSEGVIMGRLLSLGPFVTNVPGIYNVLEIKNTYGNTMATANSNGEYSVTKLKSTTFGDVMMPSICIGDNYGLYVDESANLNISNGGYNVMSTMQNNMGVPGKLYVGIPIYPETPAHATICANDTLASLRCTSNLTESVNKVIIDANGSTVGIEMNVGGGNAANIRLDPLNGNTYINSGVLPASGVETLVENNALTITQNKDVLLKGKAFSLKGEMFTTSSSYIFGSNMTLSSRSVSLKVWRNVDMYTLAIQATWNVSANNPTTVLLINLGACYPNLVPAFTVESAPLTIAGTGWASTNAGTKILIGYSLESIGLLNIFPLPMDGTVNFTAGSNYVINTLVINYTV